MTFLDYDQTLALLDKLSRDDAFRLRFQHDPTATLSDVGIDVAARGLKVPASLDFASLASKEAFAVARNAMIEAQRSECLALIFPLQKLTFGDAFLQRAA